jgi:membrane protein YdbS with pleckstrin-like domain
MSAELFPTGNDPLRRLWTMTLTSAVFGLVAIVYTMVNFARGRTGEEWMIAVGACLLVGAVMTALVQGVLKSYGVRIAALEKQAAADATRPATGTPS